MRHYLHLTKYLNFEYKLNNGNDQTFWFNLILLLMKINNNFIFLLKQFIINIIDYNYAKKTNLDDKFLKFPIKLLFSLLS